MNKNTRLT